MRVAHVLVSVSRKSGGLFHSVAGLANAEARLPGLEVEVHGVQDEFSKADAGAWQPLVPRIHAAKGPAFLGWAPRMKKAVLEAGCDIVHNHGLWQDVSRIGLAWQRRTGRPHIVAPRGMLDPWALANSGWKKKLAGAVFENRHLREAACLHALCEAEAEAMRAYGLRNPIAVVPNGVALPAQRSDEWRVASDELGAVKTLLFLGRLHPKKGLPEALRGWAEATRGKDAGWRFVIAGWDQGGHEGELKRMCRELGLRYSERGWEVAGGEWRVKSEEQGAEVRGQRAEDSVVFAGPAFGETKEALLRSADAFILPSLSEGLPMSVLEAWAYGLPVLMTEECNLPEGFAAGAAIRIGPDGPSDVWRVTSDERKSGATGGRRPGVGGPTDEWTKGPSDVWRVASDEGEEIAEALRKLMTMTEEERGAMGARGRALVEERFTWPKVATQMADVYKWMLGGGPRPECVRE